MPHRRQSWIWLFCVGVALLLTYLLLLRASEAPTVVIPPFPTPRPHPTQRPFPTTDPRQVAAWGALVTMAAPTPAPTLPPPAVTMVVPTSAYPMCPTHPGGVCRRQPTAVPSPTPYPGCETTPPSIGGELCTEGKADVPTGAPLPGAP